MCSTTSSVQRSYPVISASVSMWLRHETGPWYKHWEPMTILQRCTLQSPPRLKCTTQPHPPTHPPSRDFLRADKKKNYPGTKFRPLFLRWECASDFTFIFFIIFENVNIRPPTTITKLHLHILPVHFELLFQTPTTQHTFCIFLFSRLSTDRVILDTNRLTSTFSDPYPVWCLRPAWAGRSRPSGLCGWSSSCASSPEPPASGEPPP